MRGKKIKMQYCDQTGTTVYFTDEIIVPVMTMDELQAVRNRVTSFVPDGAGGTLEGRQFLSDDGSSYTAFADWFRHTFSARIYKTSIAMPPRFAAIDQWHKLCLEDIQHAHNIYPTIESSGIPYHDRLVSGLMARDYTMYVKNESGIYGPLTFIVVYLNAGDGQINSAGFNGYDDGLGIGGVSTANVNSQFTGRNATTRSCFAFFLDKGNGALEMHYGSPNNFGWNINGGFDQNYMGNTRNAWGISAMDSVFPLEPVDSTHLMNAMVQAIAYAPNDLTDDDPYSPGGTTDPQGGDGDFDDGGEDVDFSDLPTIGAANSGFVSLYTPSESQLRALASYMWSNNLFDLEQWKKIFADPMDAIIGLSIVPVTPTPSGTPNVRIGNLTTNVQMTATNQQFCNFDCGTLNVSRFYGSYLDQDPMTRYDIYLPYIGIRPLSADDIADKTLHLMYHIDILSGACIAELKVGGTVLYSFAGQCAAPVPLTSINWSSAITGAMSLGASIGAAIATGGATAPLTAAGMASGSLNQLKPQIEKSGSIGSTSGMLAGQKPYIIRSRPEQAIPQKQNQFIGYPSFITSELNMITGYTEVESVHLEDIPATADEISEIETLLKNGVIL